MAQTQTEEKAKAERLLNLCREHLSKQQPQAAIQSCQQAATAYRDIQDVSGEAKSTVNLGIAYSSINQVDRAVTILESGLELARQAGERRVEAISLRFLGLISHFLEKDQESKEFLEQSLAITRELKDSQLEDEIKKTVVDLDKIKADRLYQKGVAQYQSYQFKEALNYSSSR
jgi:tetratricopeptide (TPR) repeat protein